MFEDLLNKNYKGFAFAPLSLVNLVQVAAKAAKKGIILVNLDEKIDMSSHTRSSRVGQKGHGVHH